MQYLRRPRRQRRAVPACSTGPRRCHALAVLQQAHFNRAFGTLAFETVAKPKLGLGATDTALVAAAQADLARFAPVLEGHLAGRATLVGDGITIADYAMSPFEPYQHAIPSTGALSTRIGADFERMRRHEPWARTAPAAMRRAPPEPLAAGRYRRRKGFSSRVSSPVMRIGALVRARQMHAPSAPATGRCATELVVGRDVAEVVAAGLVGEAALEHEQQLLAAMPVMHDRAAGADLEQRGLEAADDRAGQQRAADVEPDPRPAQRREPVGRIAAQRRRYRFLRRARAGVGAGASPASSSDSSFAHAPAESSAGAMSLSSAPPTASSLPCAARQTGQ